MAIDGGMNFGSVKESEKDNRKTGGKRADKRLVMGLGIAMAVLAIGAIGVFTWSLLPPADRDAPYGEEEILETGGTAEHMDANEANAPAPVAEGFIDTGSGYGYRLDHMDESSDEVKIVGAFKNMQDTNQDSVSINFMLLDEDGNIIGTAAAGTDSIGAGEVWEFTATTVDKVKSADVDSYYIGQIQWGTDDTTVATNVATENAAEAK